MWKLLQVPWGTRLKSFSDVPVQEESLKTRGRYHLRTDMIRRVEGAPKLVDPSGWISEGVTEPQTGEVSPQSPKREEGGAELSSGGNTASSETQVGEGQDAPQTPTDPET